MCQRTPSGLNLGQLQVLRRLHLRQEAPGMGVMEIEWINNMGLSENSVPLNPKVNDHYPY